MAYNQAYSAYKETSVRTASQAKLIIILYDETIKQLGFADSYLDTDSKLAPTNIDKYNAAILKAQEIITELMVSLDLSAGGEIAKNLLNLYTFFNQELFDANISRDKKKIEFVKNMMAELRSSWVEISNAPAPARSVHAGIRIDG